MYLKSDNDLSVCRLIWREVRTSDARELWIREPGKRVAFTIQYDSHKLDASHKCYELLRLIYIRAKTNAKATLLANYCIVLGLCVHAKVMFERLKIKEKITFAFALV